MQKKFFIKTTVLGMLMIMFLFPLSLIKGIVNERMSYKSQVESEIANAWSGDQRLMGPILSIPYQVSWTENIWDKELKTNVDKTVSAWKTHHVVPKTLSIAGDIDTESRSIGIYNMTVYSSLLNISGSISDIHLPINADRQEKIVTYGTPALSLSVSDMRGINGLPTLNLREKDYIFQAGSKIPNIHEGMHVTLPKIEDPANYHADFSLLLSLRGSRSLSFISSGETTNTLLQSTWPHPSFFGKFIPTKRDISDEGFTAEWQISSLASNIEELLTQCQKEGCYHIDSSAFGVTFIEPVDVYQKVTRSLKYGILFIILTFSAFFLTETLAKKLLHPIQYTLVGSALAIFYLLLISLSEHLSFLHAYLIATLACCSLLGIYLSSALRNHTMGWAYSVIIAMLYWMLYGILRSEDFALLMGFIALYITRRIYDTNTESRLVCARRQTRIISTH